MRGKYKDKIGTRETYLQRGKIEQFSKRKGPGTTHALYKFKVITSKNCMRTYEINTCDKCVETDFDILSNMISPFAINT